MPRHPLVITLVLAAVPSASSDPAEIEHLLRTARVVASEEIGWGVTRPRKLTLASDEVEMAALWKPLARGRRRGIWENPEGEVAAYELSKLLGLDMVPPTVMREIDGQTGSLQLWVDDARLFADARESVRRTRAWERSISRMRLFDNLICNLDRNARNFLVTSGGEVVLIDHSQAFVTRHPFYPDVTECLAPAGSDAPAPERVDRALLQSLRSLTRHDIEHALGNILSKDQIESVLARRDALTEHYDARIERLGPSVLLQ